MTISLQDARARWCAGQGLSAPSADPVPGGWIRALGGVEPYLALKARKPNLTRAQVDADFANGDLWIVPGVRNCIWMVSTADLGLALRVSHAVYHARTLREMSKIGVEAAELDDLARRAHDALAGGPMTPAQIREALGDAVRSLGAEGKKRGHTTALPAALRFLEGQGELERCFADGRIDTNRVVWARAKRNLFEVSPAPIKPADQAVALAQRYFRWAGPATLDEFVSWSALAKTACKKAIAALDLRPVAVEGIGEAFAFESSIAAPATTDAQVHCLPGLDNLISLRGSPAPVVDEPHHAIPILGINGRPTPLRDATWLLIRPVVHQGAIVGFWEYDSQADACVWGTFAGKPGFDASAIDTKLEGIAAVLRDLDGSARLHSLDNAEKHQARLDQVRGLPSRG